MSVLATIFKHPVLRRVLIGALALGFGSAILTPQFNPFTRNASQGIVASSIVWNEVIEYKRAYLEATYANDGWPQDLAEFTPPPGDRHISVVSPQANRLLINIQDSDDMGDLAGTQIILDYRPGSTEFECSPGEPPIPTRYLPINCQVTEDGSMAEPEIITDLRSLSILCAIVVLICAVLSLLRHPLLSPVQARPGNLLRVPVAQLPKLDRLLRLMGRRKNTLLAAGVSEADWQRALEYAQAEREERLITLALRLGAKWQASSGWALPGRVYEWRFTTDLPVSLDRCLVYVPPSDVRDDLLVHHLRGVQTGLDVMLVLPAEDSQVLGDYCADAANFYVALDEAAQSEWLLGKRPVEVLLRLLAAQLKVTRISPYQTRGGVVRSGSFFGRAQLLARVLNCEPANYLVVGGRQLGKSSLLKAVQRRLLEHPHIACHYISLRDHRLAPRLALQFGLPAETALEQVIEHIVANQAGKRLFLLIDEADLFFRDEAQNGYRQLSTLRALSEEGRCWFMLAGFWDLYATAVLDYQSPLRNFGEVLTIGALEADACRELATVPLNHLRLGFASNALVDEVVEASGQRANLVAIICQECLDALQPGERAIQRQHLQQALSSQAVQDALAGWGRLSHDEEACRLDRIVVYHTACNGQTSLQELVALFEAQQLAVDMDALNRALQRLVLAFVLRREQSLYRFAIPLFALQFEPAELELFLRQELQAGKPHAVDTGARE
jgi:hypothetical protein